MPISILSVSDLKVIYELLKNVDEGLVENPEEDWEMEYHDEPLVDRKALKSLIRKVRGLLPEDAVKDSDKKIMMRKYSGFSRGPDEKVYARLEKAFKGRKRASVEYFSPSEGDVTRREIDVYYLSRRYIVAFCHKRNAIRKFRADRFISAKLTDAGYKIPESFDKKDHL
jgi:predicted DNA-binding transcriptional regulator YafY